MIKAVIFDFDGTVANSFDIGLICANELSMKYRGEEINYSKELHDMTVLQEIKELRAV